MRKDSLAFFIHTPIRPDTIISPKPSPLGAPDYISTTDSTQHTPVSERTKWNLGLVTGNSHRGPTPNPLFSTRQLNRFVSTAIPGELVAGRFDSSPSPDTLLLLPSNISVFGIESWVRKLAQKVVATR